MSQARRSPSTRGSRSSARSSSPPKNGRRWRASPPVYRLLLAAHVVVSVGWLGIVAAKLVLGVAALTSGVAAALYASTGILDQVFPPMAIGTVVTGVLLSLGTRWGLVRYYWVTTKLVLTVGVIVSAVQLADRVVPAAPPSPVRAAGEATIAGAIAGPGGFLVWLSLTHLLMLLVSTVVSVYKPWGRIRRGNRNTRRSGTAGRDRDAGPVPAGREGAAPGQRRATPARLPA